MGRFISNVCLLFVIAALCSCGALLKPRSSLEGEDRGGRSSQSNDLDGGVDMDADGGTGDGTADGNADGNSDGNSDGNADGNTDGAPDPECQSNEDCEPDELCIYGICQSQEGCESDADCEGDLHCDPDLGPNGACVICVDQSHCADDELCVNNECRFSCADDPNACGDGQICDAATNTCVECLADEQCELGNICDENNDCVEGCRTDRDCPSDLLCLDGSCIEGCIEDSDCPLETFCYQNTCTPGCNDDDGRCPDDLTCEDNICRFTCGSDEECGDGKICIETECVAGCRNDDDCGGWTPNCDTSVTPGVCRAGCWNGGCWGDQICNDENLCVDCVDNGDCANGYSCVDYYCAIDEPLGLCEECRDSRDCGDNNLCLSFGGNWWGGENFCARSCNLANDDCPNGYACRQKESVDDQIGAQCVPYTNGGDVPDEDEGIEAYGEISCAAHSEYLEHKQCGRRQGGGGPGGNWVQCADGAICSGWGIASTLGDDESFQDNYTCSIFCITDSDCPGEDSFCEDIPDDDVGCDEPPCAHSSRCAPNQD